MKTRKGEKTGWLLGWLGGFIWVAILSILLLMQGKVPQGVTGLALTLVAVGVIFATAPWNHPGRPYWQLMLPVYAMFFIAVAWAVWGYEGLAALGLNRWSLFVLLPIFIPFATLGNRTWNDGQDS